jgi:hypothetical protein
VGRDTADESGEEVDSDGDLVLAHRPQKKEQHSITIHHSLATPLDRCGQQVWPGACLLADWVLAHQQQLQGQIVVESGSGVGLVGVLAGKVAHTVFVTDADGGALQLAHRNAAEAATGAAAATGERPTQDSCPAPDVRVRLLDWLTLFDTQLHQLPPAEVLQLLNTRAAELHSQDQRLQTPQQLCQAAQQLPPAQHQQHHPSCLGQGQQVQQQQQEQLSELSSFAVQWSLSDLQLLRHLVRALCG